jgi:hypothetical protein
VVYWFLIIFFLSYYVLEFNQFIFCFNDTYNSQLNERYEDEPSTHPDIDLDLWLEGESFGGPNRNRVYGLSNTTTETLWTTRSASVIGCSQSIPSSQTLEFTAMLDQRVQDRMTHLNDKYECLPTGFEELHQLLMEMRSQMGGSCAPPTWLYGSSDNHYQKFT